MLDPNKNNRVAGYVFNELKFSDTTKAQIAGRIEHVNLSGTTPAFIPELFDLNVDPGRHWPADATQPAFHAEKREHRPDPESAMGSGRQHHRVNMSSARQSRRSCFRAARTMRPPLSTSAIPISASKPPSRSRSDCDGQPGPSGSKRPAYYTKFNGFIYRRLTGNTCEDVACVGPADPASPLELNQAIYSQRDATFRGGEFQSQFDIGPLHGGIWGIESQFDVVRATFSDGTNVPRIPPVRAGGGLFWRDANWLTRINLLHAFAQNDIALIGETPTAGYNLLKAEVSYKTRLDPSWFGAREMMVGLVGNNLLNENIRNSVSYTKDEVLLPGIGVRAFANLKF